MDLDPVVFSNLGCFVVSTMVDPESIGASWHATLTHVRKHSATLV